MESWQVSLTAVASNGNVTQLYPTHCPAGVDPSTANAGDQIRRPCEGTLYSLQAKTDGTNGGTVELWDISGHDSGIDVSSAATLTNAQMAALVTAGLAKKMYEQNVVADGTTPISVGPRGFIHGLAARFSNSGPTGTCELNLVVRGGFVLTTQAGDK